MRVYLSIILTICCIFNTNIFAQVNWTAVDYALPEGKTRAAVTLANPLGITVLSAELDGRQGKKALDLRGLSGGVYTYTIRCGEHLKTGKLVVTK